MSAPPTKPDGWSRSLLAWTNGRRIESHRECGVRLLCFPHAGGGASSFWSWTAELAPIADVWAIQLPGRESRWSEPAPASLVFLAETLADVLAPLLEPPFALFGHSMGGFVGFELARALRRRGAESPACLLASGTRAPHLPDPDPLAPDTSDERFLLKLRALNGIPDAVLQEPGLLELVLPTIRADLAMCAAYSYTEERPLDCPIATFGGSEDKSVPVDYLRAWARHTTGRFSMHLFPGSHFFVVEQRAALLRAVMAELLGATNQAAV